MEEHKRKDWERRYGFTFMNGQLMIYCKSAEWNYPENRGDIDTILQVQHNDIQLARFVVAALNNRHNYLSNYVVVEPISGNDVAETTAKKQGWRSLINVFNIF